MPIPITARGAKMLKDELQRLKTQDRPAVVQAIAEAREKETFLKMPNMMQPESLRPLLKAEF